MSIPAEQVETDWADAGCSKRSCRYGHSREWGLCAYGEEPPPDTDQRPDAVIALSRAVRTARGES